MPLTTSDLAKLVMTSDKECDVVGVKGAVSNRPNLLQPARGFLRINIPSRGVMFEIGHIDDDDGHERTIDEIDAIIKRIIKQQFQR